MPPKKSPSAKNAVVKRAPAKKAPKKQSAKKVVKSPPMDAVPHVDFLQGPVTSCLPPSAPPAAQPLSFQVKPATPSNSMGSHVPGEIHLVNSMQAAPTAKTNSFVRRRRSYYGDFGDVDDDFSRHFFLGGVGCGDDCD